MSPPIFPIITISAVFVCSASAATPPPAATLAVRLDDNLVIARYMWLDFGNVANNTSTTSTLYVRNISRNTRAVDAFARSNELRAHWESPYPDPSLRSRTSLHPGEEAKLTIDAMFTTPSVGPKQIALVSGGTEVTVIVGKETIRPLARYEDAKTNPGVFWFSGQGDGWSGWYHLCLDKQPPGYILDQSTVKFGIAQLATESDVRACNQFWAKCEPVSPQPPNAICYQTSVQGHHEGGLMQANTQVRFTARLVGEYQLVTESRLSAFSQEELVAFGLQANKRFSPSTGPQPANKQSINTVALASKNIAPTLQPTLAQIQPALATKCDAGDLEKCLQLGLWAINNKDRPNGVAEAENLFNKACLAGAAKGCTGVGSIRLEERNLPAAADNFKKSCELGDGMGCYELGRIFADTNMKKAIIAYRSACRLRFPAPGCARSSN